MFKKQRATEIMRLVRLALESNCKSYLEIGSDTGESFLTIGSVMDKAVAIDLPMDASKKEKLLRRADGLNRIGTKADVFFGNSRSQEMIEAAKNHGPFDLVFIDGDHSYQGVSSDFDLYGNMATKLIAFHDVTSPSQRPVGRFWREISGGKDAYVFSENWGKRRMGIGVIKV